MWEALRGGGGADQDVVDPRVAAGAVQGVHGGWRHRVAASGAEPRRLTELNWETKEEIDAWILYQYNKHQKEVISSSF